MQLHVANRREFRPYLSGLAVIQAAAEQAPGEFAWRQPPFEYEYEKLPIDLLTGSPTIRKALEAGTALQCAWQAELESYAVRRGSYLQYT